MTTKKAVPTIPPQVGPARAAPIRHALYSVADVEAAMGPDKTPSFDTRPPGNEAPGGRPILRRLVEAGENARWRTLARPDAAAIDAVGRLDALAPHMRVVTELVVRRLRAGAAIGLPIRLPPLLLLGPPGVGKTWYMARLARALGVAFRQFPANLASLSDGLSGSHPVWQESAPGLVAKTLLAEPGANPLILVDELDKPPAAEVVGNLYRPFFALLEPENARAFVDEHLGFAMDASAVLWVASANSTEPVPSPILDRLTVVEVGEMGRDDRVAVLRSVYADLNERNLDFFDPEIADEVIDHLASETPRRARLALDDGMTRAAAEGRRSLRAADLAASAAGPPPRRRRTRVTH